MKDTFTEIFSKNNIFNNIQIISGFSMKYISNVSSQAEQEGGKTFN